MTYPQLLAAVAAGTLWTSAASAQTMDHSMHPMPAPTPTPAPVPQDHGAMDHQGMDHAMPMPVPPPQDHAAMGHAMPAMAMGDATSSPGSGTALLPAATPMRGIHLAAGDWMMMAHGYLWGVTTDQSGARGDDMSFVQSMAMATADRDLGSGAHLQLRSMLSLEPLMGRRGYPNLLATGETANGIPLVDRQHPHDLFMELAARVDVDLAPGTRAFLYGGPVAEPALGPSAFMHRPSATYLPLAPITHHWFDSTHITYGVVTAGVRTGQFQIEGSAFRGREPDEERWDLETPALDSWSARLSWTPTRNWVAQVSHGRLKQPEAQHPGEDEARTTASATYDDGHLAATLAWSAKNRVPGPVLTAWLGEATWRIDRRHVLFGRVENVANDELFPDHDDPLHDRRFRVTRAEAGYAYRVPLGGEAELALGGSLLGIAVPRGIEDRYRDGAGYTLFARLSVGQ